MSNYSTSSELCRVDFYKSTGKWASTEVINWSGYYEKEIRSSFDEILNNQFPEWKSYIAVCLDPYHKYSHPLMRLPK